MSLLAEAMESRSRTAGRSSGRAADSSARRAAARMDSSLESAASRRRGTAAPACRSPKIPAAAIRAGKGSVEKIGMSLAVTISVGQPAAASRTARTWSGSSELKNGARSSAAAAPFSRARAVMAAPRTAGSTLFRDSRMNASASGSPRRPSIATMSARWAGGRTSALAIQSDAPAARRGSAMASAFWRNMRSGDSAALRRSTSTASPDSRPSRSRAAERTWLSAGAP